MFYNIKIQYTHCSKPGRGQSPGSLREFVRCPRACFLVLQRTNPGVELETPWQEHRLNPSVRRDFYFKGSIFLLGLHTVCMKGSTSSFYFIYSKLRRLGTPSFTGEIWHKVLGFPVSGLVRLNFLWQLHIPSTCTLRCSKETKPNKTPLLSIHSSVTPLSPWMKKYRNKMLPWPRTPSGRMADPEHQPIQGLGIQIQCFPSPYTTLQIQIVNINLD